MTLDLRDTKQINAVVDAVPPIDVLVNNAGLVIGVEPVTEVDEEVFDTMFGTNVKGLLFLTKAVVRGMKERQSGHVINLGSIAGKQAYPNGSIYCGKDFKYAASSKNCVLMDPTATKYAVDAITTSLRHELVDTPIRVSLICPGLVNTEFSTVRYRGDKNAADNVYKGMQPMVGQDIGKSTWR